MKIAITGPHGQLGSELVKQGGVPLAGRLMSEEMLSGIEALQPDAIVNCAALTDVDHCEKEPLLAAATNMAGVEWLSHRFRRHLAHISTDYIFDGRGGPYGVRDTPNPINLYGWSKLGGELALTRRAGSSLIIRTTILFGNAPNNFVSKILAQLKAGKTITLYNPDIVGTPTYVPFLAGEILRMVRSGYTGVAHVAGKKVMTRYDFAQQIAAVFGYDSDLIRRAGDAPGGATRPPKAGLICDHSGYNAILAHDPLDGLKELAGSGRE